MAIKLRACQMLSFDFTLKIIEFIRFIMLLAQLCTLLTSFTYKLNSKLNTMTTFKYTVMINPDDSIHLIQYPHHSTAANI